MNSKKIDLINVGLIFVSLILAFQLPFELFLFSYAVLGPLHYLTEINWLKEKKFFVQDPKWIWIFIFFTLVISIPILLQLPIFSIVREQEITRKLSKEINNSTNAILLMSLLFAAGLVLLKKWQHILMLLAGTIVCTLIIKYVSLPLLTVGIFLPTIIHVYFFTLLFMIFGTINNKNKAGIAAIIFLIAAPFIIYISKIYPSDYFVSASNKAAFLASNFHTVNIYMAKILGASENGRHLLMSKAGIKIQIFIAFCYTYHYLNWFSKTSIIGWHKNVSKKYLAAIIAIWLGSIFLYWYDFRTGIVALYFLSFLHVFLEFPLNIQSIKGIVSKINFSTKAPEQILPKKKHGDKKIRQRTNANTN